MVTQQTTQFKLNTKDNFIQFPGMAMPKNAQTTAQLHSSQTIVK